MRLRIIIAVAVLAAGCSRETPPTPETHLPPLVPAERMVKVGWDRPAVAADRYQIFVDDRVVQEILPPPVDSACDCLLVRVPVPQGTHVVKVVAYNAEGRASIPATLTVQ